MSSEILSYYMHDGSAAFRFELAGSLLAEGARDLAQAWRTASSVIGGRDLIVDVTYLTEIDEAGRALLQQWHATGATLVAISPEARVRVQEMADCPVDLARTAPSPKASTWLPLRF
jgi:hypothetical protein